MSATITLLFVFTLVLAVQVSETQAQMHMDDDYITDYPVDDDHMNGSLPYYTPAMFWMYFWMLYMMVFMGPGY